MRSALIVSKQNDEIEKLSSERHAVYRRCKLEEIDLPLESGSLDDVPIEEVCIVIARRLPRKRD